MYFSAYDFTCEFIEVKSILIPVGAAETILFLRNFWQEFFCKFAALANRVSSATCEIYNLLSMFTRYLSLHHACMSLFVQLELL